MEKKENEYTSLSIENEFDEEIKSNRKKEKKLEKEVLLSNETPQEILERIWDALPARGFGKIYNKKEINYINNDVNIFKRKKRLLYTPKEYGKLHQYEYSDITIEMHKEGTDTYLYIKWTKKDPYNKKSKTETFNIKQNDGKFFVNDGKEEFKDEDYRKERLTEVYDIIEKIRGMKIEERT